MDDLSPCPFCGGKAHFDHDDDGWNWIECSQCQASSTAAVHTGEDCRPMLRERWNRRDTPDGVPAVPAAQPVAWVPIHPRTGPLWAMTTDKPDPERLPGSYPLRPLAFADGVNVPAERKSNG